MKLTGFRFYSILLGLSLSSLTGCTTAHSSCCLKPEAAAGRAKQVEAYLDEFAASEFKNGYTNIYKALKNALTKLPEDVFKDVTSRESPVVFVNSITSGIARYAHSTEFYFHEGDPRAFQEGFYLMILGDELNNSNDIEAIEGVILHELAHDYLKHLRAPKHNCEMEREANRLVKTWGYAKEYEKASEVFGAKNAGDSPCVDYFRKQEEEIKKKTSSQ